LKSNLGAIEGAAAGSRAGCKQTIATLLSIEARLGPIRGATGLVQYLLDFRAKSTHRRSLYAANVHRRSSCSLPLTNARCDDLGLNSHTAQQRR
jgi:hypothetical protein